MDLAMVYDADGGLVGEVRYVVGHLLGRAECALCDITHGPVRRKQAFDELVADLLELGVPGIHLYAMNRATSIREIYANLGR